MADEDIEEISDYDEEDESEEIDDDDFGDEDDFDYEEFTDRIRDIEDYNGYNLKYAQRELDDTGASIFLDNVLVNVDKVKGEVREFIEDRRRYVNEIGRSNRNAVEAWRKDRSYRDKAERLRNKMTLLAAGLTTSDLANVADDNFHVIEDAIDEDGRNLRKELISRMNGLNRFQRAELLKKMLDVGSIDEEQYNMLRIEFL